MVARLRLWLTDLFRLELRKGLGREGLVSRYLTILPSHAEKVELVASYIRMQAKGERLHILEAGCGRTWPFTSLDVDYKLTGVDLDADALEFRKSTRGDLDEAIVGDLRTANLPNGAFDVIYSNYVLEHVKDVDIVLRNFTNWLCAKGVLIICVPDANSISGFLTRFTPHWFHIFVYRYIKGYSNAGTAGHGPYRTYYDRSISKKGMFEFAAKNDFEVKELRGIVNDTTMQFSTIFKLIQYITLGAIRGDHGDLIFILQKR
jgi:2-polyprenyl-3-methyl-5-hydroxy-6-metoxy-1,4-benzoquinol methylase